MAEHVRVEAPAHLHVGNIDLTGDLGRLYGTIGFTINYPRTIVELWKSSELKVEGEDIEGAERFAREALKFLGITGGAYINVRESIPKHVGMGSQTALALSVGLGLAKLYSVEVDLKKLALALGRSIISALGLYSFMYGGFIVDGGFRRDKWGRMVPPLIFRYPIPENWYFVVALPYKPLPEILKIKAREEEILRSLKPMPRELSDRVARIALMQMIPAIVEEDIETFGEAITAFNRALGEFWSEKQGGIYCSPIVERGIEVMLRSGAYGACQPSWGPTFYGLVRGEGNAKKLANIVGKYVEEEGGGLIFYSSPNNIGARVYTK